MLLHALRRTSNTGSAKRFMSSNDQVERPSGAAICEALYRSRPLQPIVRRYFGKSAWT